MSTWLFWKMKSRSPGTLQADWLLLLTFLLALILPSCLARATAITETPALPEARHPLAPANTASPRDTLRSFLLYHRLAHQGWREDEEVVANRYGYLAYQTIDFSELPKRGIRQLVVISMARLHEILGRIELPPLEQIPDTEAVAARGITRWNIPYTEIDIVLQTEGARQGEFLFSKETVRQLERFYKAAQDLPYKPGAYEGMYEELIVSPGPLIPRAWISALPDWTKRQFLGETIWQWLAVVIIFFGAGWLLFRLYQWGEAWDEKHREGKARYCFGVPLALTVTILSFLLIRQIAYDGLLLFNVAFNVVSVICWTGIFVSSAWLVVLIVGRLGVVIAEHESRGGKRLDSALFRIIFRLLGVVIVIYLAIYVADFLGISITPLVAGLGVGGIAIALAIRPTLENIIGGLTLFADRPVRVGDYCRYGSDMGTVEAIGLRSTRIRTLERTLVSIPNADFAHFQLENYQVRDKRLLRTQIRLRYETSMDQLRYILVTLRRLLISHPKVITDGLRVRFRDYGEYSLIVEIYGYIRCTDQPDYLAIREDILLRIGDVIREAGSGFAHVTQREQVQQTREMDQQLAVQAEQQVDRWRQEGVLPFPDIDESVRDKIEDSLDYPPQGSPDADAGR